MLNQYILRKNNKSFQGISLIFTIVISFIRDPFRSNGIPINHCLTLYQLLIVKQFQVKKILLICANNQYSKIATR